MNTAEAQLEVASHLAEAKQQLEQALQACGDYLYLASRRPPSWRQPKNRADDGNYNKGTR